MVAIRNSPVDKQVDIIGQLRKDVDELKAAQNVNQLNYSALHDTALPVYGVNNDGVTELKSRIGKQPDGNYAIQYVNGSAPPMPANIGVAERQLGILITWDGTFLNNATKPSDFARLDIYIGNAPGFPQTVDFLMGSLYSEAALFIGLDVEIHYVRVVAVNTSDVPSTMTAEVAVTPLPAGQLAAHSVNAINLAAEIVLATTIIIGDVDGGRLVFSPENGLELYMPDGTTRSVHMNHLTGDLTAIGTYKTAVEGARVEWNPGGNNPHKARFYPSTGSLYGEITVEELTHLGVPYALIALSAASTEVTGESGWVFAHPGSSGLVWGAEGQEFYSKVEATEFYATLEGPGASVIANHNWPADASGHRVVLSHKQANGVTYPNSILEWKLNANSVGYLRNPAKDSSIVFETLGIHARNAADNAHIPMYASAFTPLSSLASKVNVQDVTLDLSAIIRSVRSKMWERPDKPGVKYIGPIAEDLPAFLQRDMGDGNLGFDLVSLVGILWNQVSKLTADLESMKIKLQGVK
jgi:hypothetical protein